VELETRLQRLRDSKMEEEAVYEQISKMPGELCDTLQQVCSEMVRAKTAEDGRRAKERKLFYGELNNAHTMLSDTEAALQKQTESVHEVGGMSCNYTVLPCKSMSMCFFPSVCLESSGKMID